MDQYDKLDGILVGLLLQITLPRPLMSGFFNPKHFLFLPIKDLLTTTLSQNDFLFDYFQCDVCCFKRKTLLDFWGFL